MSIATVGLFLFISHFSFSQIPTATWQTHFDYTNAKGIEIVQNKVYSFSKNGFFYYDKALNQVKKLSKIDGLSDSKVVQIRYNDANKILLVAYSTGNLDAIKLSNDGKIETIKNIDFIKKSIDIQGSKTINQIEFQGNNAYLACDFGLVNVDIQKLEIKETYQNIGENGANIQAKALQFRNDSIFVKAETGILGAKFSSISNLQYFGNWKIIKSNTLFQKPIYPTNPLIVSPNEMAIDAEGKIWIADDINGLLGNLSGSYAMYNPNGVIGDITKLYYSTNAIYALSDINTTSYENNTWKIAPKIAFSNDLIDHNGYRWQIAYNGITVYDDKKNLSIFLSTLGLPSSTVNSITEDKDGQIWLGTANGVAVTSASSDIFTKPATFYLPIYKQRRLLLQENVTKIAVDGGNRKWIGTDNGIFLFNSSADELIQNFTTENSPLPSNKMLDIAIDATTGEVFMATSNGLISYRSDATESAENFSTTRIFPNPVRPEFQGVLTVSELMNNSSIKITDIAGRLVYETKSNGGTATWNLADASGNKVPTGVYLVFAVSEDGLENFVGKVGIVK